MTLSYIFAHVRVHSASKYIFPGKWIMTRNRINARFQIRSKDLNLTTFNQRKADAEFVWRNTVFESHTHSHSEIFLMFLTSVPKHRTMWRVRITIEKGYLLHGSTKKKKNLITPTCTELYDVHHIYKKEEFIMRVVAPFKLAMNMCGV